MEKKSSFNMALSSHPPYTSMMDGKRGATVRDIAKLDTEIGVVANHMHTRHDPYLTGTDADFSGVDEAKVLRKMDIRLIPNLGVLYLLCFLDRGKYIDRLVN
jgi:hypothetical protein